MLLIDDDKRLRIWNQYGESCIYTPQILYAHDTLLLIQRADLYEDMSKVQTALPSLTAQSVTNPFKEFGGF